jgi:nucleotide-binding universal stress UspA family protein
VTDLPDAIVRRAAQTGADLVVMGTHGRTGMDRLLQGSVAEQLLRRATVPVLLVRVADDRA